MNSLSSQVKGTYLETLLNEQRVRQARSNLLDFTTFTKRNYYVNWHHELICKELDKFVSGITRRLIISVPPRNGKTELVSRRLPAYLFGINPDAQIIACSYGADLAQHNNRDVQRIIDSKEYAAIFPDTYLNDSNVRTDAHGSYIRNSDTFEIVGHTGAYNCSGIGGAITGKGMNYGIVDDYHKNREEAESLTIRNKVWDWYNDVFSTREEGEGGIIVIATRWHKDDLIGRLLKKANEDDEADQWEVINLPALSEETLAPYDQRTGPDQPLWPWKFSYKWLKKKKANLSVYSWLSLYQQRPVAISGNLISESNFKYCSIHDGVLTLKDNYNDQYNKSYLLSQCRIFQTCDPATSINTLADYFSLGTWAQTPNNELALIDLLHEKMEKPKQIPLMRQQYHNWHPSTQWIGSKGLGLSLFQDLRDNGLPVNKIEEVSNKISRFTTACDRISTGTVYFLDNLPHKQEFKTQLLDFPNGEHDDMVDITGFAVFVMINRPYDIQTYKTTYVGNGITSGGIWI